MKIFDYILMLLAVSSVGAEDWQSPMNKPIDLVAPRIQSNGVRLYVGKKIQQNLLHYQGIGRWKP